MSNSSYNASNIQVLEGLQAVRKRPSMYIGDIGIKGLHHLIWEVVDNTIDEAMAGFCSKIFIKINKDNSITVSDNGRGIPVDIHPEQKKSALEVVMTILHAGGKFDKDTYKVSGGLHGVGISCVNALSSSLSVQVFRDGKIYEQKYEKGIPLFSVKQIGSTDKRGTTVTFLPDDSIFTTTTYNYSTISTRIQELSFLNQNLEITLEDHREEEIRKDFFCSKKGIEDFVLYLNENKEKIIDKPIILSGEKNSIPISIGLIYNSSYQENLVSYVNNINTVEGGTHVAGFRKAITKTMKSYAEKSGIFEKTKLEVIGDDFREGLTAVISVKVSDPQFEGQTKSKLGNQEVSGAVESFLSEYISSFLEENPKEAKLIIQKVILAAQARAAAKKARELVQRKTVMSNAMLPGKLADCSSNDAEKCELFIVEGDSAGGTAKQARDREYQAILPLRGKILNIEKAHEHKIYENEQVTNIITAIGVILSSLNSAINLDKIRYKKIIIMTDADVDGSHIKTLILTLFYRYMKDIIANGYLYVACPPLFLIKKGNTKKYCWNNQEKDQILSDLQIDNKSDNNFVQRYKGLGEMNYDQLWETTMDPEKRIIKKVSIESAIQADRIFSTLMGDDVLPRKNFIEENCKYANLDI
jgi:DNA gyrase subunit B